MKREKRRPWLDSDQMLCVYCRYAEWHGWGQNDDGETEWEAGCSHPIDVVGDHVVEMDVGVDCWGFRPMKGTRPPSADRVGESDHV